MVAANEEIVVTEETGVKAAEAGEEQAGEVNSSKVPQPEDQDIIQTLPIAVVTGITDTEIKVTTVWLPSHVLGSPKSSPNHRILTSLELQKNNDDQNK